MVVVLQMVTPSLKGFNAPVLSRCFNTSKACRAYPAFLAERTSGLVELCDATCCAPISRNVAGSLGCPSTQCPSPHWVTSLLSFCQSKAHQTLLPSLAFPHCLSLAPQPSWLFNDVNIFKRFCATPIKNSVCICAAIKNQATIGMS